MSSVSKHGEALKLVFEALMSRGLNPKRIPHGSIYELRGGVQCFELKMGGDIDAAIILSKTYFDSLQLDDSKSLYKVDYSVRGGLKGVLPGRIISGNKYELRGLFRKRITGVRWETPLEDKGGYLGISDSRAPGPGELWEGGPHHALTKRLNQDPKLNEALMAFALDDDNPLNIVVFSDRRGESIRISGHPWLEAEDVSELYAAPVYLEIVGRIGQQVKEVRRAFGGLTF